jgi:nucleoside-diphosphate-sugar epimerase
MKISVVGLGFLGVPLARLLLKNGHEVIGTTTSEDKKIALLRENISCELLRSPELPSGRMLDCDWLVINVPPFEGQLKWFESWDLTQTKQLLFVSSTSVLREGPHSQILREEEAWVKKTGLPYTIVRPGGLLGHGRHPGKHLSGKSGIKGRLHPVNLIHADDVIGFISTIIDKNIVNDTFEVISDEHHTKEEFYSDYCRRNDLLLPQFDPADHSSGVIISNEKMKRHYQLKIPTMIGRSL